MANPNSPTALRRALVQHCKNKDPHAVQEILARLDTAVNPDNHAAFVRAVDSGSWECAKLLLPVCDLTNHTFMGKALKTAALNNDLAMAQHLVNAFPKVLSNAGNDFNEVLRVLARANHAQMVSVVLPAIDRDRRNLEPLNHAADLGHLSVLKVLLKDLPPTVSVSEVLRNAAYSGHATCVEALLPLTGVTARAAALTFACKNQRQEAFDVLYAQVHPDLVEAYMNEHHIHHTDRRLFDERLAQEAQKRALHKAVASSPDASPQGVDTPRRKM